MIVLEISNQRSYFYIRVSDVSNIAYIWLKLSEKGYFKLHHIYDFSNHIADDVFDRIQSKEIYFDSLDSFLKR